MPYVFPVRSKAVSAPAPFTTPVFPTEYEPLTESTLMMVPPVAGEWGVTLASAISVTCGRDRHDHILRVSHDNLPILPLPFTDPDPQLFNSMLSDPRAVCGIDPTIGAVRGHRTHRHIRSISSWHRINGAPGIHRDATLQSPPPACA